MFSDADITIHQTTQQLNNVFILFHKYASRYMQKSYFQSKIVWYSINPVEYSRGALEVLEMNWIRNSKENDIQVNPTI